MKTPKEWLAHIKQASDTEPRHGSSVILLESDIEAIQRDAGHVDAIKAINCAWMATPDCEVPKLIADLREEIDRIELAFQHGA